MTITAMTGHLQKAAFMQLSQLEKAVLTSVTLPCASLTRSLLAMPVATLLARTFLNCSRTPPCRLLTMATSTGAILSPCPLRQACAFTNTSNRGRPAKLRVSVVGRRRRREGSSVANSAPTTPSSSAVW